MNKYKILIFDLDDTLIDNFENTKFAFKKMIAEKNIGYSDEEFLRWNEIDKKFWEDWQDDLIEIPEEFKNEKGKKSEKFTDWVRAQRVLIYFNNSVTLEEAIRLNHLYMHALKECVIEIAGAREILQYLSNKYYIIVATNGPSVAARDKLLHIDCLDLVNEVLSADMFGYMKPKKEYFTAIQKVLNNYNNEEYLIIGDSLKSDVGFGMNCNFDSCWFDQGKETLTNNYKPTIIINNLSDLKKYL